MNDTFWDRYLHNEELEDRMRQAAMDAIVFGTGKVYLDFTPKEPRDFDLDMNCGPYGDEG